jgi:hypothetical protein
MRAERAHDRAKRSSSPEETGRSTERREPAADPAAATLLALQRTSGNKLVGAMLARQPAEAVPADAKKDDAVSSTLVMDDVIGVLPLLSFSRSSGSEIGVTVPSSATDSVLMRYASAGTRIEHVKISTTGFNLDLDDVYISSIQISGADEPVVQMSLSFAPKEKK